VLLSAVESIEDVGYLGLDLNPLQVRVMWQKLQECKALPGPLPPQATSSSAISSSSSTLSTQVSTRWDVDGESCSSFSWSKMLVYAYNVLGSSEHCRLAIDDLDVDLDMYMYMYWSLRFLSFRQA